MLRDIRYAGRILLRNAGFAVTAIGSTACGIAGCTAVFTLVYALLFRPLAVPRAEDLVSIYGLSQTKGSLEAMSLPDYQDLAAHSEVFEGVGAYFRQPILTESEGEAERATAELATGNYHALLGLRPVAGRMLRAEDDRPGAPGVVVLSEAFWRRQFAGRADAIGRLLRVNGAQYEIVGIAPASFTGVLVDWYAAPDVWMPLAQLGAINKRFERLGIATHRDFRWLQVTARLRDGVTVDAADAALRAQAQQLARAYPDTNRDEMFTAMSTSHARFWPGRRGAAANFSVMLLATVVGGLLIAVLNVANLLLARLATRQREISIRLAIGANRVRIVRQLLIEALVLSGIATVVSVPLTIALTSMIARMDLPFFVSVRALDLSPDWRVLAVVAALCAACGLVLGAIPAWHAWRADVRSGLTCVPTSTRRTMFGTWDARHTLATLQIAVCLVLTLGGALLAKKLVTLSRVDLGYATDRVTLFELESYLLDYTREQHAELNRQLLTRVRQLPGVEAAAMSLKVLPSPMIGTNTISLPESESASGTPNTAERFSARFNVVTDGYFDTIRMPLIAGRVFDERDTAATTSRLAIVNEIVARKLWGDPHRAIGRTIRVADERKRLTDREVIGVVKNAVYGELDEAPRPYLFLPIDRSWEGALTLHVRGPRDATQMIAEVRRELQTLAPSMAFASVRPLDQYVATRIAGPSLAARLAVAASTVGMALAIVGLYAVLAYLVAQRRTELAIRMSIGAGPREIVRIIAGFGLKIALVGTALGIAASFWGLRLIATQLNGIDAHDPPVYASVIALVLMAAFAACLIPARRAARLEPWVILRR
jgi:predicted permease